MSKPPNTRDASEFDTAATDCAGAIVVGVDGSPTAARAAEWAAREAVRRQLPLRLVHFVSPIDNPAFRPGGIRYRQARDMLDTVRADVLRQVSDADRLDIETAVLPDHPGHGLVTITRAADLVVVGTSGAGLLTRMVVGSTALALAREAHCPVVIARRPGTAAGPVLVPVIGRLAAEPLLTAGLRAASLRGTEVLLVRVWQGRGWASAPAHIGTSPAVTDSQIAHCRRAYPTVEVRSLTITDHTTETIENLSGAAQLIVTSHHDNGGDSSMDPCTKQLVRRADCPVLILPGRPARLGADRDRHRVAATASSHY
ncbi:universal stress protein [Nocardia amikacinitolerans]|uniref:universal stress protein n=1 Tax=Nocardia amikacinitolerans TaxID=756689 RepID=UPI0020A57FC9|nr:universal stress protein [Nocardia amikacinitolerans]MCP2292517.1 Nucleotide-binding universal stress protein, UspA family [Nocardia amikacinitolerans]